MAAKRAYLDFSLLRRLSEKDGGDAATAFTLVFCRVKHDYNNYKVLMRLSGLREAIQAERDSFVGAGAFFAADSSKQVREAAGRIIGDIPLGTRLKLLSDLIASESPGLRSGAAALVARVPGAEGAAVLKAASAAASSKAVRSSMERVLADHAMGAVADNRIDDSYQMDALCDIGYREWSSLYQTMSHDDPTDFRSGGLYLIRPAKNGIFGFDQIEQSLLWLPRDNKGAELLVEHPYAGPTKKRCDSLITILESVIAIRKALVS